MSFHSPALWTLATAVLALAAAVAWSWILMEGLEIVHLASGDQRARREMRLIAAGAALTACVWGSWCCWQMSDGRVASRAAPLSRSA